MVTSEACRRATCDSSAMVTLSRNRRCTRVLTVPRNHVAVAEMPRPIAATCTSPGRCPRTPSPSSLSHNASRASGSTASCEKTNATSMRRGSKLNPSLHRRHIDRNAGGSLSPSFRAVPALSGEDIVRGSFLLFGRGEALGLHVEHRPVTSAFGHQFVMRAQLDDPPMFEHANAVCVPHGGKPVRNENRCALACGFENAFENLRLAAD